MTNLEANSTGLEEILAMVNALPEAGAGGGENEMVYATGSYVPTEDVFILTITHNLGVIPKHIEVVSTTTSNFSWDTENSGRSPLQYGSNKVNQIQYAFMFNGVMWHGAPYISSTTDMTISNRRTPVGATSDYTPVFSNITESQMVLTSSRSLWGAYRLFRSGVYLHWRVGG